MKISEVKSGFLLKTKLGTFRRGECGTVIEVHSWGVEMQFGSGSGWAVEGWKWYELEVSE
jgi:hypothetical protein